ncbi:MAG: thymidylate kinase [Candidatus Hodarchaeota archaeon]
MGKKNSKNYPKFIVVDGGDGAGKDTQARLIAYYYLQKGFNVRIRSHPVPDNLFGRFSKKALEGGGMKGHLKASVFYTADVIRSLVKYYRHSNREVIIFSRYLLGVCYLPSSLVFAAYNFFATILPIGVYFFFIDVTPENAIKRITGRGEKGEMFETLPRLQKMQHKMRQVTYRKKWFIINGNKEPEAVWHQIRKILVKLDSR